MSDVKTVIVTVREAERRAETIVAEGPRILVGAGAHCDVCLPPGAAAPEHFEISMTSGGELVVTAIAEDPPALLAGIPFRRERLPPGAVITLGPLTIEAALSDDGVKETKRVGPGRAIAMGVAGALALALSFALGIARVEARPSRPPVAPALWADARPCPTRDAVSALAMANDLRARADSKRERVRFAIHDGVEAVDLLGAAAACYRETSRTDLAAEAVAVREPLRAKLDEAYRGHQLRLEHALSVDETDTALHEVRVLRALTPHARGPWVDWLATLEPTLDKRSKKRSP